MIKSRSLLFPVTMIYLSYVVMVVLRKQWKIMYPTVRSKRLAILNTSSSKKTTIILPCGRTAYLVLTIPIEINELSTLTMKIDSLGKRLLCYVS